MIRATLHGSKLKNQNNHSNNIQTHSTAIQDNLRFSINRLKLSNVQN